MLRRFWWQFLLVLFLFNAWSFAVFAQDEHNATPGDMSNPEGMDAWKIGLLKTITYRIVASGDVLVGGYLLTGSPSRTLNLVLVTGAEQSVIYYLHELSWSYLDPPIATERPMGRELEKSLVYRCIAIANVFLLSYLLTGSVATSTLFLVASSLYDSTVYFLHEMAWNKYGPKVTHP